MLSVLVKDLGGSSPIILIMEATAWISLFSDCYLVVSLRSLVVPASIPSFGYLSFNFNVLWCRVNTPIQVLPKSFLCKGSFFSHLALKTEPQGCPSPYGCDVWQDTAPARRGHNPQCRPPLSSDSEFRGWKFETNATYEGPLLFIFFLNVNLIILLLI